MGDKGKRQDWQKYHCRVSRGGGSLGGLRLAGTKGKGSALEDTEDSLEPPP